MSIRMKESVGASDVVPEEDLQKRIGGLKKLMAERGIDFAVIVENVDKFYLTGTMQAGMLVVPAEKNPLLFLSKGTERARPETTLNVTPVKSDKEIGEILSSEGILNGRAGFELDVLPVSSFERLKRFIRFDHYTDITPAIKELRAVKSPFELEQIKKSGAMASHVFAKAGEVIREGVSEIEIDAALVAEGRRLGHQGYLRMRGL